jgi:AcrR family transcriptional regulator
VATHAKAGPGRRPAGSGTRDCILKAARQCFAELGYDRTTVRGVAARAGVDAALIFHYFGSKQQLLAEVTELPFDPAAALHRLLDGPRGTAGRRLTEWVMEVLEEPESRTRMTALIRAAAAEDAAAQQIRERITRQILTPLAAGLDAEEPELRATLIGAHLFGLVMARQIVELPLPAIDGRATLVDAVSPVIQHYLTGDLHVREGIGDRD